MKLWLALLLFSLPATSFVLGLVFLPGHPWGAGVLIGAGIVGGCLLLGYGIGARHG